jgi:hypothetical protein
MISFFFLFFFFLLLFLFFFFFFFFAPQPDYPLILNVPASATRCLHVHTTRETLVAKGGTSWERIVR